MMQEIILRRYEENMSITKNMFIRIYSDRTEDVKIDELNKLLENGD